MSEDGRDPRQLLLTSLDAPACRIEYSDRPIVLLCGGRVPIKTKPEDSDPPLESLRHAISKLHTAFEIFRPEEITSWQSDGVFKDLMTFETELASICSLVVILVESEGALVELGAFSQLVELADKILAICPEKYINDTSFINLGILRFIAAKQPTQVRNYPWTPKRKDEPSDVTPEVVNDVVADIGEELTKLPKTQLLKADHHSHTMVLICELLKLFSALKESEILEYLAYFGIKITKDVLQGKLFLLAKFRLVKTQTYSDALFYLRGNEPYHKLRISLKDSAKPIDILRIEILCLEYYRVGIKHRNRIRAIALAGREVKL